MFDIGGWEFLLIAILGIIIIGPKELPGAIRTVSMFVRRARGLAREFQSGLEDVAREAEFDKLKDDLTGAADPSSATGGLRKELEDAVDPDGNLRDSMDFDADWRDDDMINYDDPEFADDNKMLAPDKTPDKSAKSDPAKKPDTKTDTPDIVDEPAAAPEDTKPGGGS